MLAPDTILQSRYRITRQLGQGGMGTVYEAKALRLNTTVALKETHFTDERLRKQFEREAQLLAGLRHPALPRVIDHFDEGDGLYLVMDFIEGNDLWEMMGKRVEPFPVEEVLIWADQLLDALHYLHTQAPPIIHRDIKPQNLKLTKAGQIILLDFGLAKGFAGEISRAHTTGSIFGYTPNYAPLEQIKGTGTDARSDLYSLAATLYHLMTGVIPPDALSRASAKVDDEPDPLKFADEVNPEVSHEVAEVLQKAVAQSPGKRFATASQMRQALSEASEAVRAKMSQRESILMPPPTISGRAPTENVQEHQAAPWPQSVGEKAKAPEEKQPYSTFASPTIAPPIVPPPASGFSQQQFQPVWPQSPPARPVQKQSRKFWLIGGLIALGIALIALVFYVRSRNSASDADAGNQSYALRSLEPARRARIFDRSGKIDSLLALNRQDASGKTTRVYPMGPGLAHLIGTEFGAPGLDRALFTADAEAKDVRLTISRELQQAAVEQFKGRRGAVVILNPQTGEVLAMYSNPSYDPQEAQSEETWKRLDADQQDKPLVNRALNSYYVPGSTFTTLMMIAAHRAGIQDTEFVCSGGGYIAMPGAKPIFDDGGPGEVHGQLEVDRAYEVACNQYFAQMAVQLGPERIRETAKLVGIGAYDVASDTTRGRQKPELWNASSEAIKRALAPTEATMLTGTLGQNFTLFDLALEGYGQGYAGQMTPFQMALLVSAIGNMEGKLMKPKIEYDRPPETFNQVMTPQVAARLREIMGLVTGGPEGTARGVFAPVKASGINAGGKTGTAQKILPVYDPRTGEPVTRLINEKDAKGNIIGQHQEIVLDVEHPRIDGWFLCIAPLDRPSIAMAVIVEGGGYGSKSAAPIAAALVLKAKELGLLEAAR